MDTIPLGAPQEQVISSLGQPIKETSESGMIVLWYTSKAPTLADFYLLQDGNVTFSSVSYYIKPQLLSDFISMYGTPALSLRKYDASIQDSLMLTVHAWPDKGKAVTSIGSDIVSQVIREDTFQSMTREEYLKTWGKDLVGHEETTIVSSLANIPGTYGISQPMFIGVGVLCILLVSIFFICMYRLIKRMVQKKKSRI